MSDMDTTEKSRAQLSALASYVDEHHDSILQNWRAVTESVPELVIASSLTRLEFDDHIPGVLDAFAHRLRAWPGEESVEAQQQETKQVKEHGLQRWQQGYQLRELISEWGYLQMCLMEELESYEPAHPNLEPNVMATARRALAHLCWEGITDSTAQYWQMHKVEATGHVRYLEQALSTLNQLERARAAAWREAAHDLRGSVGVVTVATSLLDSKFLMEPMRLELFDILRTGVTSLQEMLNDLMSLARLEAGQEQLHATSFDAAILLTHFCTNSLPLAQDRGLFLKMEGPDSLPVQGDQVKIQRILQNLLLNALKYTQRGGVTVMWGAREDQDTKGWMFCVQDTGPGLSPSPSTPLARQVYESTQTAQQAANIRRQNMMAGDVDNAETVPAQSEPLPASQLPGEGVGLSIVKRLCELLNASLELETSPGEGCTFRVILPCQYDNDLK